MRQTIQLKARIIQVATVDRGRSVGYGATHRIDRETRIATIAIGYSDGYPRHLSNRGHAVVKGFKVPVVGRVSMDLATLDVTAIPPEAVYVGAAADLIGPELTIDDLASEAGTIGYEVLTRLGRRYPRRYVRPDASG